MRKISQSNFIREICVAGAVIDVTVKFSNRSCRAERAAKCNPSREAVIKQNDRNAIKNLTRLINANFNPGDLHVTHTYAGTEPSPTEAKKDLENYLRRMKREYARRGREFKWIAVTEYKNHRIHHHIVMSYIDPEVIERQWKKGHVKLSVLDRSRNYRKLAEYLTKETSKTMRTPGSETKRRWSSSRNLTRPIVKREIVSAKVLYEAPKALKGYEIDEESIRKYEHPFTGIEHLEYLMISTDPVPRLKSWRSGKAIERGETYRRASEIQLNMEDLDGWDLM